MSARFLYFLFFSASVAFSQKYNFVNYSVEDGLIQSQALSICQDQFRQLWISTEGGLSKFDGKKFTGYSVQEGLSSNRIGDVLCDRQGNIVAGTEFGISIFNGKKFRHIPVGKNAASNIGVVRESSDGRLFATNNYALYVIEHDSAARVIVSGDPEEDVTTLYKSPAGALLAYVYGKGLFALNGNNWQQLVAAPADNKGKFFRDIFITHYGDTLLGSSGGLFRIEDRRVKPYYEPGFPGSISVHSMAEDARRNLWLGTDKGAYRISKDGIIYFNSKNGFTDNAVYQIYKDVENNLWFATDADGIFNFRENTFTYYDKSSGMANPIVMGIVETKAKKIYLAGYGGGLYSINEKSEIESVELNNPMLKESKISSLYTDDKDNIYIGTLSKGVWVYNEKKGLSRIEGGDNGLLLRSATSFLKDGRGNLLIGNPQGLFVRDSAGKITRVRMPAGVVNSLKQFNRDSVLVGATSGLYFLNGAYVATPADKKEFAKAAILCLDIKNRNIWMGTTDRGLLNWNLRSGKITNYSMSSGLPSNFIYSIYVADEQTVWAGTGFGISNLYLTDSGSVRAVKNYGRAEGLLGMECNHNAVLRASDSGLWFGTTKGLFHFNPSRRPEDKQPLVVLKSVKLFSSPITDSTLCRGFDNWFNIPQGLKLRSGQNHLTFEVGGIYLTNPDAVRFKYKLDGIDDEYVTSANPVIVYASLPPGKYVLKIMGVTKSGVTSVNTIEYPFEIRKAFYQTGFFQMLVVLLLISSGALVVFFTSRRKQKRKEVLERIREEEFMKLRHRTAEDFHDEVGNRLTRISVLADILKTKVGGPREETMKIVRQIKDNTNALYAGSRDIIWSLNPQNDGIYEIAEHIRDIGAGLFNDTPVEFNFSHNISRQRNRRLKLDYSRNLIMAFKEIYNNILKHSDARQVDINLNFTSEEVLLINVRDNGKGFDAQGEHRGNGLRNIRNRVSRMNGKSEIASVPGRGTEITIELKNIFV